MKKLFMLFVCIDWAAIAGVTPGNGTAGTMASPPVGATLSDPSVDATRLANQQQAAEQAEMARQETEAQRKLAAWMPRDPWRIIDGQTNWAKAPGWKQFAGKVLQVLPDGIIVTGTVGFPGTVSSSDEDLNTTDFFVADYPYQATDGEHLYPELAYTAKEVGVYNYVTVQGASRTITKLRYGKPCDAPPPSPEFLAAQAAAEKARAAAKEKAKKQAADRTLNWNQEQADAGDAYGELRMGERYRDGKGVDKDLAKARMMFEKAAAQGNKDAAESLKNLPQ